MNRRLTVLVVCAFIAVIALVVEVGDRRSPTGFQFHTRVTVRLGGGFVLPPAHDLRRLITTQDIEQNVRVRMLAETGPFIIRVRSAGRSSVTFDVFTVNDWWHGQVERALQEECLAQIGRSAPKSSIGFQLDPVPTLAESWRELVRTYLGFLPWFARAKN